MKVSWHFSIRPRCSSLTHHRALFVIAAITLASRERDQWLALRWLTRLCFIGSSFPVSEHIVGAVEVRSVAQMSQNCHDDESRTIVPNTTTGPVRILRNPSTKQHDLRVFLEPIYIRSQIFFNTLIYNTYLELLWVAPRLDMICSRAFRALMRRNVVYRKRNLIGSVRDHSHRFVSSGEQRPSKAETW